jgi:hypothetical protein
MLYVSLHTADPGVGGAQNTSEAAYTNYTRIAVVRTSTGWTVTGNVVNPAAIIVFPAADSAMTGSEVESFAAVGIAAVGAGKILYRGPISPPITVTANFVPQLPTVTALTEN